MWKKREKGLFIIQTSQPEHPIYGNILHGSSDDFNFRLLVERKDFDFPPYTRIIELTIKDRYEDRAERMAFRLASDLGSYIITGPYSPAIDKVADQHIRKIRLSMKKDKNLSSSKLNLRETIARFEKSNGYDGHITIDVDPA